ncbi:hypothetical protein [Nostoc punctiforme]|uniref:Uncharacterized protein n=1 Tax=Nostoc punctiforme (strain ATCC 29133 / PCC 73102) TaxID=63737 RepID=B2J1H5_NOSP7|nr:hypothetical protein [Nostoc punctiforme]ACC80336.1 hypothetical protein Npun_F1664 [Nostoc punctiforme PCC 73102]
MPMFGFDGSTKAIIHFLEQIRDNKEGDKLTHKEVRAYGRLMLNLLPNLQVDNDEQIQVLLAAMSSSGLPHYDRSFAAEQILKLLQEQQQRKLDCPDGF